jgi:hypothetical protein
MRRGRIIALLAVLCTLTGVVGIMPATAAAASPLDICRDLVDNGRIDGAYTQAELEEFLAARQRGDAILVGYCGPLTTVAPPPVETPQPVTCTEVSSTTPGATRAPNGKYYTNVPEGGAAVCGPATPAPQTCVEVPAGTAGATVAPNGKSYTNLPAGGAEQCGPAAPAPQCVEVAAGTAGAIVAPNGKSYLNVPAGGAEVCGPAQRAAAPVQQVAGATKVKTSKPVAKPTAVSPAQHSAAPLATTRSTGTLPFTGAELGIFALVGIALLGGGLMLRMTSRGQRSRS